MRPRAFIPPFSIAMTAAGCRSSITRVVASPASARSDGQEIRAPAAPAPPSVEGVRGREGQGPALPRPGGRVEKMDDTAEREVRRHQSVDALPQGVGSLSHLTPTE